MVTMRTERSSSGSQRLGWLKLTLILATLSVSCPARERAQPPARSVEAKAAAGGKETGAQAGVVMGPGFTLSPLLDFGHRDVKTFAFSQRTRELFVSFSDRSDKVIRRQGDVLCQWDVAKLKRLHTYRLERRWLVDELFLSPSGKQLLIRLYLPENGHPHWAKYILLDTVRRIVVNPDLKLYNERNVKVRWNARGDHFRLSNDAQRQWVFDVRGRPATSTAAVFPRPAPGRLSVIESTKSTIRTHGLYYRDDTGTRHRVTNNQWHDNFALTRDGRFVVTTTWDGELLIWSTRLKRPVHRQKIAAQYGHLAYDPQRNRFLIGDATHNGTTYLRALQLKSSR